MKAGVRKRGLLGRLWARTASICADLTMKASRLGFFRTRGRVQTRLFSLSARPSFADKDKRPRVRRKKPARERRGARKDLRKRLRLQTRPQSQPRPHQAPSPRRGNRRNLPRTLAHDAPRVAPTTRRRLLAPSFLPLLATLLLPLALARVALRLLLLPRARLRHRR
jgi:hypothetical protein